MKSRYRTTQAEIRALNAYLSLTRTAELISAQLSRSLAGEKLTLSQVEVLEALLHRGPMCQRDLAHRLAKTGGNVTLVIDNLEKRDLVKRVKSTKDRRYINVELTARGNELISRVFPKHIETIKQIMGELSAEEQEQMRSAAKKLMTALQNK